jgi:hypothetical protein
MTIVRPAKTAVRLPELEKNGEGGQNALSPGPIVLFDSAPIVLR